MGDMLSLPTCEAIDMGNGEAEGGSEAAVVSGADSSSEFKIDSSVIPFCGEWGDANHAISRRGQIQIQYYSNYRK